MTQQQTVHLAAAPELRLCPRHNDATLTLLLTYGAWLGKVVWRASPEAGLTVFCAVMRLPR